MGYKKVKKKETIDSMKWSNEIKNEEPKYHLNHCWPQQEHLGGWVEANIRVHAFGYI